MASPLPTDARDRKRVPLVTGCWDYFAAALAEVARISLAGNEQHHPGEPLHHERGKSADHADALGRHLVDRGTLDTDGHRHSAKVAWRALALLQEELEAAGAPLARGARLPEAVSTPTSETAPPSAEDLRRAKRYLGLEESGLPPATALAAAQPCITCGHRAPDDEDDGSCLSCFDWCNWLAIDPPESSAKASAPSVPCAECGTRDGNGECSAQCVREEGSPAQPARVPTRECATCRHNLAGAGSYGGPCLDCRNWSHWEPRECATCRHNLRWTSEPPCCDCHNRSRWEPKP